MTTVMSVPLVDLRAQYDSLRDQIRAAVLDVFEHMHLNLGPNVRAFEQEFAAYCGAAECVGVGSGTDALHVALRALDVGPGDEVVLPAHTFIATAEAVALCGARPVIVDVEPARRSIDPAEVAEAVTPRTRAVIAVHIHGQLADMDALRRACERAGVPLVEDAAQAQGAGRPDRRAGSLGRIACFSFYYSKNLGAYGEAGAITTNDPHLAERVRQIRDHGSSRRYRHDELGMNARLDELQAAVLRVKLPHLERWNERRRELADRYRALLSGTPLELPAELDRAGHVYHHFAPLAPERDRLLAYLQEHGVGAGIHYPVPVHLQPVFADLGYREGSLPVAERVAAETVSLPLYPELTDEQQEYVAERVRAFYREA